MKTSSRKTAARAAAVPPSELGPYLVKLATLGQALFRKDIDQRDGDDLNAQIFLRSCDGSWRATLQPHYLSTGFFHVAYHATTRDDALGGLRAHLTRRAKRVLTGLAPLDALAVDPAPLARLEAGPRLKALLDGVTAACDAMDTSVVASLLRRVAPAQLLLYRDPRLTVTTGGHAYSGRARSLSIVTEALSLVDREPEHPMPWATTVFERQSPQRFAMAFGRAEDPDREVSIRRACAMALTKALHARVQLAAALEAL